MNQTKSTTVQKSVHKNAAHEDTIVNRKQPNVQDRVKLIYVDEDYSGLTEGICGTVTGISVIREVFKSVNRSESIIWVKWDNGIELGLIEGTDKYEIINETAVTQIGG